MAARETRRARGRVEFLSCGRASRAREGERQGPRHTCASTSGRNSGRAAKKRGKQNCNAAARAAVAIMGFTAAENVAAITADNAAPSFLFPPKVSGTISIPRKIIAAEPACAWNPDRARRV